MDVFSVYLMYDLKYVFELIYLSIFEKELFRLNNGERRNRRQVVLTYIVQWRIGN